METMNDNQLDRCLRSIGKMCFVDNYHLFANFHIPHEEAVEFLMENHGYKETGARTRVSCSRRIIRNGRVKDALKIIEASGRVPNNVREAAKKLSLSM